MADAVKMTVNELPTLTYNFLRVNRAELEAEGLRGSSDPRTVISGETEGVIIRRGVSRAEIAERVSAVRERISRMDSDPENVPPNGDTSDRHSDQLIRTGLGIDVDRLMDSEDVPFILIETEPGADIEEPVFLTDGGSGEETVLSRRFIHVKKGSRLTVACECSREQLRMFGSQTLVLVEEGAELRLSGVQMCGADTLFFDDTGVICLKGASVSVT